MSGPGYVTLKGPRAGISRDEFEYRIPLEDALEILNAHCDDRLIQKIRHLVDFEDQIFEVDVFEGRHSGLVIAELELSHEAQRVILPSWIGEEVTHDRRYGNFYLAEFGLTGMPLASGTHRSNIVTSSFPFGRRN